MTISLAAYLCACIAVAACIVDFLQTEEME